MKPTRNRFFCRACGKTKMLFETERQADNYIRFNSSEVLDANGHAPVRSYYCNVCMGWHVTSNRNAEHFKQWRSKAETAVDSYIREKEEKKLKKPSLAVRAETYFADGDYKRATDGFLQAFHALKDKNAMEQSQECLRYLRQAFMSACNEMDALLSKEDAERSDVKRCATLHKSLAKAAKLAGDSYEKELAAIKKAHGKLDSTVSSKEEAARALRSPEELAAELEAEEKRMQEAVAMGRRSTLEKLKRDIQKIRCYIMVGQRHESVRLLHKAAGTIRGLMDYDDIRNDVIPSIDEILSVKKLFEDTFLNGGHEETGTISVENES